MELKVAWISKEDGEDERGAVYHWLRGQSDDRRLRSPAVEVHAIKGGTYYLTFVPTAVPLDGTPVMVNGEAVGVVAEATVPASEWGMGSRTDTLKVARVAVLAEWVDALAKTLAGSDGE